VFHGALQLIDFGRTMSDTQLKRPGRVEKSCNEPMKVGGELLQLGDFFFQKMKKKKKKQEKFVILGVMPVFEIKKMKLAICRTRHFLGRHSVAFL
jgi:hypothetical protein